MKKVILLSIALFVSVISFSQGLIISEYVEGSANNRAIELYNTTSSPINLKTGGYQIVRYGNGSPTKDHLYTANLIGIVPAKGCFVIVADKRDPNGTGYNIPVDTALQSKADTFMPVEYSVNRAFSFNGNDAIAIEKSNGVYVDIFGDIGVNPGHGWTMDATAGYTTSLGATAWTKNHTLIRKANITSGVTTKVSPFIVANEWDSLPKNTFTFLGSHPNPVGIQTAIKYNHAFFYPNPVVDGWFMVKGTEVIEAVEISNIIGQSYGIFKNPAKRGDMKISTANYSKGIYLIKINFADNTSITKKIVLK